MTIDKVRQLIALAAHPTTPTDEARTSAVIACRLIIENGFDVRAPNDLASSRLDWFDLFQTFFGAAMRHAAQHSPVDDFMSYVRKPPRPPRQNGYSGQKGGTKKRRKKRAKRRGQ